MRAPTRVAESALLLSVLSVLSACGPRTDAERYRAALVEADAYGPAAALCADIGDRGARGDCLIAVMERFQRLEIADCDAIRDGLWHDECVFALAERARAHGDLDRGLELCLQGRFARSCSWHLLQDEVEASLEDPPKAAELRIAAFAHARRIPDAAVQFWMIRFRERSAAGHPLDEADCEGLKDSRSCEAAVIGYVRQILDAVGNANREQTCNAARGERVKVGQAPAWAAGPVALRAEDDWVRMRCAEGAKRLPGDEPPMPPPRRPQGG